MLATTNLHRRVFAMAWPMIIAGASIPLLGIVDTAILGHLNSVQYLSAAAVGSSVLSLLFWLLSFLRMGTTGLTARAFGAQQLQQCHALLWQSLYLACTLGLLVIVCQQPILNTALWLLGPSADIANSALNYCQIRIFAAPATLCSYVIIGWLLGLQKAKHALLILTATNISNIALDFLLIVEWRLNSDGAAWASLIAEYLGLGVASYFVRRAYLRLGAPANSPKMFRFSSYLTLLTVNRDLFLRTACIVCVFTFFTAQGARLGDNIVAANAILMQLILLVSYALDGFAHAAETLVGHAVGAKDNRHFQAICRSTFLWGGLLGLACCLSYLYFQTEIIHLFTTLDSVALLVEQQFLWVALLPLLACWSYLLDGVFLGLGETRIMRNTLIISTIGFFMIWKATLAWENTGLWLAFFFFMSCRSLLIMLAYTRKNISLVSQ